MKQLRDEGFTLEIRGTNLLVHHIPYVTTERGIARGTLVCDLTLAGDKTAQPGDHTAYFIGGAPCDNEGNPLTNIINNSNRQSRGDVEVNHFFSAKPPPGNYSDYYEKVRIYTSLLEGPAQAIDPTVTVRTFKVIETADSDDPFQYLDTNSSRGGIETINAKLRHQRIAIIGTGGTGSYVLDLVAKTPVAEIHLFDGDDFLSHNAFRAPGAASLETLRTAPKKVAYLHEQYTKLHKRVIPHVYPVEASNLEELDGMHFVFICIDDGESRRIIFDRLIEREIPFVDVGIGLNAVNGGMVGNVRVTAITPHKNDHIGIRVPFADQGHNEYEKNVQIAEINALNAALAVIKWKKLCGFYHDQSREYHSEYSINLNIFANVNDENNESKA